MTVEFPHTSSRWVKKGFICKPEHVSDWWHSHAMAPSAVAIDDNTLRVYVCAWPGEPCGRIGFIDTSAQDPTRVIGMAKKPVLDIGVPGTFDDNGVFPAHAILLPGGIIRLYYTGFQHSTKTTIDHLSFGGLAISTDGGTTFSKVSQAPILDRADEGLHIRAGLSVWQAAKGYHCVYSAGTGFRKVGGKLRPIYEIYYQFSSDGISFEPRGRKIVSLDSSSEHGLGRPQLFQMGGVWYVFYTRRTLNMKYHMGCAWSLDLMRWERCDSWLATIPHGPKGNFDSEMVYFPSVVQTRKDTFLFYSGNEFGREGMGYAVLER